MRRPSGDHRGFESGLAWVTRAVRAPVATSTIEMSADPPSPGSLVVRWSKAMRVPSGDQSKLPTTNEPQVSARVSRVARSIT